MTNDGNKEGRDNRGNRHQYGNAGKHQRQGTLLCWRPVLREPTPTPDHFRSAIVMLLVVYLRRIGFALLVFSPPQIRGAEILRDVPVRSLSPLFEVSPLRARLRPMRLLTSPDNYDVFWIVFGWALLYASARGL